MRPLQFPEERPDRDAFCLGLPVAVQAGKSLPARQLRQLHLRRHFSITSRTHLRRRHIGENLTEARE
jgi:hypothetical protein